MTHESTSQDGPGPSRPQIPNPQPEQVQQVEQVEAAILRTLIYADQFNFPMTMRELHHFLISGQPVAAAAVESALQNSPRLRARLHREGAYIALAGREAIIHTRVQRQQAVEVLWPQAMRYGRWLAALPFVRMVAITGALAAQNPADAHDDLDYLLVTVPGRVWTARAFAVVLVRIARLWGVELCPNYVLATNKLAQARQDLFIAHEITQCVPVYGHDLWRALHAANPWVGGFLPNAPGQLPPALQSLQALQDLQTPQAPQKPAQAPIQERRLGLPARAFKGLLEAILRTPVGAAFERWERERKLRRFAPVQQQAHSAAELNADAVKGHFNDHGHPIMQAYQQRLSEFELL